MIALAVSLRVVDELSVRLAGATEARDRRDRAPARRRHQGGRRGRAPAAPRRLAAGHRARARLPAQPGLGDRRRGLVAARRLPGRRHGDRDRRGPRRHRGARVRAGRARSWRSPRPSTTISRRARRALGRRPRRAGARCRRRASFGKRGPELADGELLDPNDRALSEHLSRGVGALVVQRTARRRVRTLLGREIPFGVGVLIGGSANFTRHAPHRPHGTALLRVHRQGRKRRPDRSPARACGTRAGPRLGT